MSSDAGDISIQVGVEVLEGAAFVGVGIVLKRAATIVLSINVGSISITVH